MMTTYSGYANKVCQRLVVLVALIKSITAVILKANTNFVMLESQSTAACLQQGSAASKTLVPFRLPTTEELLVQLVTPMPAAMSLASAAVTWLLTNFESYQNPPISVCVSSSQCCGR